MNRLRLTILLTIFLLISVSVPAQKVINLQKAPELNDNEVQTLVEKYRNISTDDLKLKFAQVKADQPIKDSIAGLPDEWKRLSLTPAQAGETRLWIVGKKALKITSNPDYEFIYIRNIAPLAVSDSNCLLLVTSGMLRLTDGDDDALLGVMIHEFAHALFVPQSIAAKTKINEAIKAQDWDKLEEQRKILALIEIECDLIAARLLKDTKHKINRFADVQIKLEEAEANLKIPINIQWHPDAQIRKKAILDLGDDAGNIAKK